MCNKGGARAPSCVHCWLLLNKLKPEISLNMQFMLCSAFSKLLQFFEKGKMRDKAAFKKRNLLLQV